MTLLLAAALATGCADDDIRQNGGQDQPSENIGYLSLSGLNVSVLSDTEVITGSGKSVETRAEVNVGDFTVEIIDSEGVKLHSFKYSECPTDPIALDVGSYTLNIYSGQIPLMAWESPVYGATKEFQINRLQETAIGKVICKLSNIKVSVEYSSDIMDVLGDNTKINIALGDNSVDFNFAENRAAFFKAINESNTLDLTITGSFRETEEGEDSSFEMTSKINNVKAGQWRKITLIIEHANDGNIDIKVEVENWVFDEVITVENSMFLMESVIVDDEDTKYAPKIEWIDNDIETPLTLTDAMFDEYGECKNPVRINISTTYPLAGLQVDIASTNPEFASALTAMGLSSSIDMCNPGSASVILGALGYPNGSQILGKQSVNFNLQPQMKQLREYNGTHTFQITATDEKGFKTVKTLTVKVGGAGATITWVGYDISQRYEITDELTATIEVTSEVGITGFTVDIQSSTLDKSALVAVGLDSHLDLVNPASDSMNDALAGLGFPTREKVLNQKSVSFTITQFLSLLDFTGNGNHDFVMTVTDANGAVSQATVMLSDLD